MAVPTRDEVTDALARLGLNATILDKHLPQGTETWAALLAYLTYRRDLLHQEVEPNLMDASQAKKEFTRLRRELKPTCPLTMNKQKGVKRAPAFLTGIVNMLVQANARESHVTTTRGLLPRWL